MLFSQIAINFSLYIGALLSIFLNRKNFISVLIGMELLLLSINLNLLPQIDLIEAIGLDVHSEIGIKSVVFETNGELIEIE